MPTRAEDNPFPSILMVEQDQDDISEDLPATGQRRLVVGLDHLFYLVDDAGVATQVGGGGSVAESDVTFTDITTNNASTSKHGYLRKLDNNAAHFLDGTGAWSTPGGGAGSSVALLEHHTASSSSSLDFSAFISSGYGAYQFIIADCLPATDNVDFLMRMGTGGGPTYDSGANYANDSLIFRNGSTGTYGGTGATAIQLDDTGGGIDTGTATDTINGVLWLFVPSGSNWKRVEGQMSMRNNFGPSRLSFMIRGAYESTTAVTAVRFLCSSGNIASGSIYVYGYPNA